MAEKERVILDEENEESEKYRKFTGWKGYTLDALKILLIVILGLYLAGILTSRTIFLLPYQLVALSLSISFILVFMMMPATKSAKNKVTWYDILFMVMGTLPSIYAFYAYSQGKFLKPIIVNPMELVLGICLLITIVEAGRRLLGMTMGIITAIFLVYPLVSYMLPGVFLSRRIPFSTLVEQLYFSDSSSIFTKLAPLNFELIWVFLLFATFLKVTGGAQFFIDLALSVVGRFRGGAGKAMVVASALMGTLTGSAVADVAAVGSVTIPFMKSQGYSKSFSGALAAAAGTGAHIVPPVLGTVAFVMSDIVEIPYWSLCVAALFPALIYYVNLFMAAHFYAVSHKLAPMAREEVPSARKTFLQGGQLFIPIIVLVFYMGVLNYRPAIACLYAFIALIIVSFIRKKTRLDWKKFLGGVKDTAFLIAQLGLVLVVVSPIVSSLDITGLGPNLSGALVDLAQGNVIVLLVITGVACYFLGLALPTVTSYLLLALLVAPALVGMGIPKLAAHMFILFITLSDSITPPLAPAAYVAAGIAGAPLMRTAFLSMLLGIGIIILPFYFVLNPELLLIGGFGVKGAIAIFGALIGAVFLAASVGGHLLMRISGTRGIIERILLVSGAITMMAPQPQIKLIGFILGALVIVWQFTSIRIAKGKVMERPGST